MGMHGDPLSPGNIDAFLGVTDDGRARFERHQWAPATAGSRTCIRCGARITLETINDAPRACMVVVSGNDESRPHPEG